MAVQTLRTRRSRLKREWAAHVAERRPGRPAPRPGGLRAEIAASWERTEVDPARDSAPVAYAAQGDVAARWHDSPLSAPVRELSAELRSIADEAGFIAAVTDGTGTILWTCGGTVMRDRAAAVNFQPGGRWDESAMGTSAPALALRERRPVTVFAAEHLVQALHGWVCYSAPLRAPDGRLLGVLDLSSTWDRTHPMVMPTLRTLAAGIEHRLARLLPTPTERVRLEALAGPGRAWRDGAPMRLRPRQLEILTLLALEPDGFTPERLLNALHGDRPATMTSVKAHVSHLRAALGAAVAHRHYLLTEPVTCDAVTVREALAQGDVATAVQLYSGPLLPDSEAPGITRWREYLEVAVRSAVLAATSAGPALTYGERHPWDLDVHRRAHDLLAADDPRRGIALARLNAALRA